VKNWRQFAKESKAKDLIYC